MPSSNINAESSKIHSWSNLADNRYPEGYHHSWEEMWGAAECSGGGWAYIASMDTLHNSLDGGDWQVWSLERLAGVFDTISLNHEEITIVSVKMRIYARNRGTYHRLNDYGDEEYVGDCPAVDVVNAPGITAGSKVDSDYGYLKGCADVVGSFPAGTTGSAGAWVEADLDIDCLFNREDGKTSLGIRFQNDIAGASPPEQYRYAFNWPGWYAVGLCLVIEYTTPLTGNIVTSPATNIATQGADIHGRNDNGLADCFFQLSDEPYNSPSQNLEGLFNYTWGSLLPGTEYWFAAYGVLATDWGEITETGEWLSFVTVGGGSIETLQAKYITKTSACIGARYTGDTPVQAGWQWKWGNSWQTLYWWAQDPYHISSSMDFWYTWPGLSAGRTYYYRAFIILPDDTYVYGSEMSFKTETYPVIFKPGYDYLTAKQAIDPVAALALGRYYMDPEGNLQYESRLRRLV